MERPKWRRKVERDQKLSKLALSAAIVVGGITAPDTPITPSLFRTELASAEMFCADGSMVDIGDTYLQRQLGKAKDEVIDFCSNLTDRDQFIITDASEGYGIGPNVILHLSSANPPESGSGSGGNGDRGSSGGSIEVVVSQNSVTARPGDSIWSLMERAGFPPEQINSFMDEFRRLNGLDGDIITSGNTYNIPSLNGQSSSSITVHNSVPSQPSPSINEDNHYVPPDPEPLQDEDITDRVDEVGPIGWYIDRWDDALTDEARVVGRIGGAVVRGVARGLSWIFRW